MIYISELSKAFTKLNNTQETELERVQLTLKMSHRRAPMRRNGEHQRRDQES